MLEADGAAPQPRTGEPAAADDGYDAFFDDTYPFLLKVAMAAGADLPEAEDAAAETMGDLYRRWGTVAEPRAYARRAVLNAVARVKKRDGERLPRTVAGGHLTPESDDGTALTAWEDREWVRQHLSALPPAQLEVMVYLLADVSTAEIAAILGKTQPTIRKNLQWARERLKARLAEEQRRDCRLDRTMRR